MAGGFQGPRSRIRFYLGFLPLKKNNKKESVSSVVGPQSHFCTPMCQQCFNGIEKKIEP